MKNGKGKIRNEYDEDVNLNMRNVRKRKMIDWACFCSDWNDHLDVPFVIMIVIILIEVGELLEHFLKIRPLHIGQHFLKIWPLHISQHFLKIRPLHIGQHFLKIRPLHIGQHFLKIWPLHISSYLKILICLHQTNRLSSHPWIFPYFCPLRPFLKDV
jgi:hypothetical protein